MRRDMLKAKWKQIRGRSKMWKGQLTGRRLDKLSGRIDLLAGKYQEKFQYSRQKAASSINQRLVHRKSRFNKSRLHFGKK